MRDYFLANSVGNPFETTLAVGRLIGADVPGRFPEVRLILCHAGGSFPFPYGRLDAAFRRWPRNREVRRRLPADLLRWFWYDTVLFSDEPTRYLLDLVGRDRVLAGTDCPFAMADYRPFEIPDALGLDAEAATAVLGSNALSLFRIVEDGHRPRSTEALRFADSVRWYLTHFSKSSIGPNRVNQLAHVQFFQNPDGVLAHMAKHRVIIAPKFAAVQRIAGNGVTGWVTASRLPPARDSSCRVGRSRRRWAMRTSRSQ